MLCVCVVVVVVVVFVFFNDPATTEIYTLSLHDALPILQWGKLIIADGGVELRLERRDQGIVCAVDILVGEGFLCVAIGERISEALLAVGHVFATEHIEELDRKSVV